MNNGKKEMGNPGQVDEMDVEAQSESNGKSNGGGKESKTEEPDEDPRSDRMYIDLGSGITNMLTESRYFHRPGHWQDRDFLEPSSAYARFLLPPSELKDMPETALCTRYLHTSINRIRHPVTAVRWTPEGRRLITGNLLPWNQFYLTAHIYSFSKRRVHVMEQLRFHL